MHSQLAAISLVSLALITGCATSGPQQTAAPAAALDQNAGTWRPWVLSSGQELRLPRPPDAAATAAELQDLRGFAVHRNAAEQERIRYWDYSSPSARWNDILIDINAANPLPGGDSIRALAMLNIAMHDAMIAAWDSKYAYKRSRPGQMDGSFKTAVPTPPTPSYPCERSVAAGAAAAVIAHIYPKEAQRLAAAEQEVARSRMMAGAAFPSDTKAGIELGRAVAARVIDQMKLTGGKWTGTVPSGPGLWKGTNPVGVNDVAWKRFVLESASQYRPAPPPAHDSPERVAELAEVRSFNRTPFTNSKVHYWQFGQQGQPGLLFRLSDEVGRRLAEDGAHASAPRAARAYALVHVAHYEAWIASQDGKFHYWTARPLHFDPTISTVIPTPPFPTYPSNAATLASAPVVVLAFLFPREKARYDDWAREFGQSRLWAGIHFRSDITAGHEIGRRVGEAVVARARADGALAP